jgi:hypothetical protein
MSNRPWYSAAKGEYRMSEEALLKEYLTQLQAYKDGQAELQALTDKLAGMGKGFIGVGTKLVENPMSLFPIDSGVFDEQITSVPDLLKRYTYLFDTLPEKRQALDRYGDKFKLPPL